MTEEELTETLLEAIIRDLEKAKGIAGFNGETTLLDLIERALREANRQVGGLGRPRSATPAEEVTVGVNHLHLVDYS